jgi:hypothetical protein
MVTLKDRNRQIPNGLKFSLPELNYQAPSFASFNTIVQSVYGLMRANPGLAQERDWPIDVRGVERWVDNYNAEICKANGWTEYYINDAGGSDAVPIPTAKIAYAEWPLWAKAIALMKKVPPDKGVGDTVERVIGPDNSEAFQAFYKKTFGRVCGCNGRKADWNIKYQYE